MIYGYARVSTDAQDLESLSGQLKAAGAERIYSDSITGTHTNRPQLKRLLRDVRRGDVVLIPACDRLSRSATDLLVIARDLDHAGVALRSITQPIVDTASDFKEVILAIFGVAA